MSRRLPLRPSLPRLRWRRERLAVDVRDAAVYWARSVHRRGGFALRAWGRIDRRRGAPLETLLADLARRTAAGAVEVDAPLRSEELRLRRIDLPRMSIRDARQVAARRAAALGAELGQPAAHDFRLGWAKESSLLWLCAAPEGVSLAEQERWCGLGFELARLSPHHLALASLARVLPEPGEDELVALFDLSADLGSCVVVDRRGWVFGRDFPLRYAGERRVRREAGEAIELEEEVASLVRVERLAVELDRTFQYVRAEIRAGRVGRVVLAGEEPDLAAVAGVLAANTGFPVELIGEAIPSGPAAGIDPGAAVALGLALAPDASSANLLPTSAKREDRSEKLRRQLSLATVAAALLAIAAGGAAWTRLAGVREQVEVLQARWEATADVRARAAQLREARERAGLIEETLGSIEVDVPPFAVLIDVLGRLLPDNTAIHSFEASQRSGEWIATIRVVSRGRSLAEAAQAVASLREALDTSPLFAVDSVVRESSQEDPGGENRPAVVQVTFVLETRLAVASRGRSPGGAPAPEAGAGHG